MFKKLSKILIGALFIPFLISSCKSNDLKNEVREFKGRLEIAIGDFKGDNTYYNLSLENGDRYEIVPANQKIKLKLSRYESGDIIRVKGVKEGNKIYIVEIK